MSDAKWCPHRIGIAGLGLIGGSVALAARRALPTMFIRGVEREGWPRHRGLADALCAPSGLDDCELVVLAAPVDANIAILRELAQARRSLLVTDVGGTKGAIRDAARDLPKNIVFVGGHPMAGSENAGPGHARADLFDGQVWFVVRGEDTPEDDVDRVEAFVEMLGAVPIRIEAETHDRIMAAVSHVPQLVASALMTVVGESVKADGLSFAGRGLIDTTRLSGARSEWLPAVINSNREHIGATLDLLVERLQAIRRDVADGRSTAPLFETASEWRDVLLARRRSAE